MNEVALLAEGVDRNTATSATAKRVNMSPSSRRAWIEIVSETAKNWMPAVALLAEGVDRNCAAAMT